MKSFFKRKRNNKIIGGIDMISCGIISGWVISKEISLMKIKCLYGEIIISSSEIDICREDVNTKYNFNGNSCFNIFLPSSFNIKNNLKNVKPKIIVVDAYDKEVFILKLFNDPNNTLSSLSRLMNSKEFGQYGRYEFINNRGDIIGWSGFYRSNSIATIWVQNQGYKPIPFICDKIKSSVCDGFIDNCGFMVEVNKLPDEFIGKELILSFDEDGHFPLINLPEKLILKKKDYLSIRKSNETQENIDNNIFKNIQIYKSNLDEFRKFIDLKLKFIEISNSKKEESIFWKAKKVLFKFFKG